MEEVTQLKADQIFDRMMFASGVNGLRLLFRELFAELEALKSQEISKRVEDAQALLADPGSDVNLIAGDQPVNPEEVNLIAICLFRSHDGTWHDLTTILSQFWGSPQQCRMAIEQSFRVASTQVLPADLAGDSLPGISDREFLEALQPLTIPYMVDRDHHGDRLKTLRAAIWYKVNKAYKGDYKKFRNGFNYRCETTLQNMRKRIQSALSG